MTSLKHKILFAFILAQAMAMVCLIASFYIQIWPFELLVSLTQTLTIIFIAALSLSSVLFIFMKDFKNHMPVVVITVLAWLAVLYILFFTLTTQQPTTLSHPEQDDLTFAIFNKNYNNHDDNRYIDYFKQQQADVIAMQEMHAEEVEYVADQLGFDYYYTSPPFATAGWTSVAVISRYPFASVETVELSSQHPVVRAVVQTPSGGEVAFYSVHAPVPSSNFLYNKRNIVLDSLASTLSQEELPMVVGGDFNTTIYSPAMRTFSSAVSPNLLPVSTKAWPVCSLYGYGFCIRIDHVFISKGLEISSSSVGPDLGSDHRAIITKLHF